MVVSKENVVVTVPADFTLSESCQELMNQLAATIYKWDSRSETSTSPQLQAGFGLSCTLTIRRVNVLMIGDVLLWASVACPERACCGYTLQCKHFDNGLGGVRP